MELHTRFSNVALLETPWPASDASSQWVPLILVQQCNSDESSIWGLLVNGDLTIARDLITSFGELGAVRFDLDEAFDVEQKEFALGGCAKVARAWPKQPSAQVNGYALKRLTVGSEAEAIKEASFLLTVGQHPHICRFRGVFCEIDDADIASWSLLFDYYPHRDLFDCLAANGPLSQDAAVEVMIGVSSALSHIHSRGILHRDVKAENVLLDDQGQALLIDFGIATFLDTSQTVSEARGSPCYAAPEVVLGQPYDWKADVFSAGVLFYYILSRKLPFSGSDLQTVLRRVVRCRLTNLFDSQLWASIKKSLKDIITLMLQKTADTRVSSFQALRLIEGAAMPECHASWPQPNVLCQDYGGNCTPWSQSSVQEILASVMGQHHGHDQKEQSKSSPNQIRIFSNGLEQIPVCMQRQHETLRLEDIPDVNQLGCPPHAERHSRGEYSEAGMSSRDSGGRYSSMQNRESWEALSDVSVMHRESYNSNSSTDLTMMARESYTSNASTEDPTMLDESTGRRCCWNDYREECQQGLFAWEDDLLGDVYAPNVKHESQIMQGAYGMSSKTKFMKRKANGRAGQVNSALR